MGEDEDSWANVANPPEMIMKLMLLEKKEGFIKAFMAIKKNNMKGVNVDSSRTMSWLVGLWLECGSILQRDNPDLYARMAGSLLSSNVNDHVIVFQDLMLWLDKKGLKWDVRGGYDRSKLSSVHKSMDVKMS